MYFYKLDYSNEINSPFARDNKNKLIRRSYWLDLLTAFNIFIYK